MKYMWKENEKMRKELKKVIEKIAIKAASSNVNETCSWITYQPKVPESVKKLKKHWYGNTDLFRRRKRRDYSLWTW